MSDSFAEHWQNLLRQGFIDDRYPLSHSCVQLPNGHYGIRAVLDGFAEVLTRRNYEELLLPTISVNNVFNAVPQTLKNQTEATAIPITHTGIHSLDVPYSLSTRPDLVIPQIIQISARSYRDLPVRLIQKGFRYATSTTAIDVSLVTDTELSAIDAESIFANENEYLIESETLIQEFDTFLTEKLRLSTFSVHDGISKVWWAILPDHSVIEVARLRKYGQELSTALGFKVLQPNNHHEFPYILNFTLTSTLFAVLVAVHTQGLPMYLLRTFGTSHGVDVTPYSRLRFDLSTRPFTGRFQGLFVIEPGDCDRITLRSQERSETIDSDDLEERVLESLSVREANISISERCGFLVKYETAIRVQADEYSEVDGLTVLGFLREDGRDRVSGRIFGLFNESKN
jgi:hypothetical protein